jgi:hypothetical protein
MGSAANHGDGLALAQHPPAGNIKPAEAGSGFQAALHLHTDFLPLVQIHVSSQPDMRVEVVS